MDNPHSNRWCLRYTHFRKPPHGYIDMPYDDLREIMIRLLGKSRTGTIPTIQSWPHPKHFQTVHQESRADIPHTSFETSLYKLSLPKKNRLIYHFSLSPTRPQAPSSSSVASQGGSQHSLLARVSHSSHLAQRIDASNTSTVQ